MHPPIFRWRLLGRVCVSARIVIISNFPHEISSVYQIFTFLQLCPVSSGSCELSIFLAGPTFSWSFTLECSRTNQLSFFGRQKEISGFTQIYRKSVEIKYLALGGHWASWLSAHKHRLLNNSLRSPGLDTKGFFSTVGQKGWLAIFLFVLTAVFFLF